MPTNAIENLYMEVELFIFAQTKVESTKTISTMCFLFLWLAFIVAVYIGMIVEFMMSSGNFKAWVDKVTSDLDNEEDDE